MSEIPADIDEWTPSRAANPKGCWWTSGGSKLPMCINSVYAKLLIMSHYSTNHSREILPDISFGSMRGAKGNNEYSDSGNKSQWENMVSLIWHTPLTELVRGILAPASSSFQCSCDAFWCCGIVHANCHIFWRSQMTQNHDWCHDMDAETCGRWSCSLECMNIWPDSAHLGPARNIMGGMSQHAKL